MSSTSGSGENADAYVPDRLFHLPEAETERPNAYPGGIVVPPPPDFGTGQAPDAAHPQIAAPPSSRGPLPEHAGPGRRRGGRRRRAHRPDGAPHALRDAGPPDDGRPDLADAAVPDSDAPPYRPTMPVVVATVAVGGAVLLAIPFLLTGAGSHDDKKHRSGSAADTILPGGAQPPPPSFPASLTPVPTPSLSSLKPTPKATPKQAEKDTTVEHNAAGSSKGGFNGAANVLLKNAEGGLCADVPGYEKGFPGLFLQTGYCTYGAADNQVWSLGVIQGAIGPGGAPLFVIRNTRDGYCIDLPGSGAQAAGTDVGEQTCQATKGENDLWYRTHVRGDLYRIRNHASHGLCFGVAGRSKAVEKRLEIHTCGSSDAWSWPSGG